ncbi:hypothetical protein J6590_079222 [Homalodisca vitripennis]|nr:hypothetical protein J6590_079222 [Homalodisca vitripennis]
MGKIMSSPGGWFTAHTLAVDTISVYVTGIAARLTWTQCPADKSALLLFFGQPVFS